MDTAVSAGDVNFALEVWAGSPAGDTCDNPGATGGTYGYFLLPFVQGGVVGDFTIENAEVTFTISGAATLDGNRWGQGLYPVVLDSTGTPVAPGGPADQDGPPARHHHRHGSSGRSLWGSSLP